MGTKESMAHVSPEAVGIPSAAITRYIEGLKAQNLALHSLQIIKDGQVACEAYWQPMDADFKHRLYSCSKSFVSVAIGLLVEEGKLSLDDPVVKFFPDKAPAHPHPYLAAATIRHMLMMATPFQYNRSTYSPEAPDWGDTFFAEEPTHWPGQVFRYDTTATTMLCMIIKRVAGVEFTEYLRPRVFDPLGIAKDVFCVETPCGHEWGGSGVVMTARDFAKVALLCCRRGRFEDRQLIPEEYLRMATSRQIDNWSPSDDPETSFGYGYQFWMTRHGGFCFNGMGSQYAICLPDKDFVLVTTGYEALNRAAEFTIFDGLWREIYPHLCPAGETKPLSPAPAEEARLRELAGGLKLTMPEGGASAPISARVSGKTYVMSENMLHIQNVRFDFGEGEGTMTYENQTGKHTLPFGLCCHREHEFPETHYFGRRIGTPAGKGYRTLTSAAWNDGHTLDMLCQVVDIYLGSLRIACDFEGDRLTIITHKHAEWFFDEYVGVASGVWAAETNI